MICDVGDNRASVVFWKEVVESRGQEAITEVEEENSCYKENRKTY